MTVMAGARGCCRLSPDMPSVSVVIATYNTAKYVGAAVRSVLDQSAGEPEVIVVDDGSTDETAAVLGEFAGEPRVRCIWQENQGQTKAKNRGIRECRAPIVGFCDADDEWGPGKLELQLPAFAAPEVGVVYSREERFTEGASGRKVVNYTPERCYSGRVTEPLFIENFVPFGTGLVRRSLLEAAGGFDERYRMSIDWDLWLRLSLKCEFHFIDEVTYHYRIWDGQMSHDWRGRYHDAIRIMENFLAEHPEAVSPACIRRAWAHTYVHRGRARVAMDKQFAAGFADIARAVFRDPGYADAWRMKAWIVREWWRGWTS
jgi:glycosyltransferase involved in cell wall biosynthesis